MGELLGCIVRLLTFAVLAFFAIIKLEMALACFALGILVLPLDILTLGKAPSASQAFFKMGQEILESISESLNSMDLK